MLTPLNTSVFLLLFSSALRPIFLFRILPYCNNKLIQYLSHILWTQLHFLHGFNIPKQWDPFCWIPNFMEAYWKYAQGESKSRWNITFSVSIYKFDINTFCLTFAITGLNFQGELQHVRHVDEQQNYCRPLKTRDIIISNCYIKLKWVPKPYKTKLNNKRNSLLYLSDIHIVKTIPSVGLEVSRGRRQRYLKMWWVKIFATF